MHVTSTLWRPFLPSGSKGLDAAVEGAAAYGTLRIPCHGPRPTVSRCPSVGGSPLPVGGQDLAWVAAQIGGRCPEANGSRQVQAHSMAARGGQARQPNSSCSFLLLSPSLETMDHVQFIPHPSALLNVITFILFISLFLALKSFINSGDHPGRLRDPVSAQTDQALWPQPERTLAPVSWSRCICPLAPARVQPLNRHRLLQRIPIWRKLERKSTIVGLFSGTHRFCWTTSRHHPQWWLTY